MDEKIIKELEQLYAGVEGWTDEERRNHINFAYKSIKDQQAAQAKYGAVDANDPKAVEAAVERYKAQNGGSVIAKPVQSTPAVPGTSVDAQDNVSAKPTQTAGDKISEGYAEAEKQLTASVDAATNAAVAQVKNSVVEAEGQFRAQRDAVALEAAQAADNSALYAELRGDKGGIGKAQYDSIQNTAAKNHAEINRAQTAFARDAAVEIASLQAKGEYEKAEKLLDIAQERLSALVKMEQWQAEFEASEREFREKLDQWQAEYELAAAKVTGYTAAGAPTADTSAKLAALGEAMLKKGLMPSAAQLDAMGMTSAQAREYINSLKAAAV